ncbi:hypothetical protein Hanom_Chr12g01137181 [Helianthus anomalus]
MPCKLGSRKGGVKKYFKWQICGYLVLFGQLPTFFCQISFFFIRGASKIDQDSKGVLF